MKRLIAVAAAVILAGLVMMLLPLISPHRDPTPGRTPPTVVVPVPHPRTTKPYARI